MKARKWYKSIITAVISFAMIIGIFGGMKLEVKATDYTLNLASPEEMHGFLHNNKKFSSGDTIKINAINTLYSTVTCYFYYEEGGTYLTENLGMGRNNNYVDTLTIPSKETTTVQWKCTAINDVNNQHKVFTFLLVKDSMKNPSDTPSSGIGSEAAPSAPSHECNFQWVTTVEPQPGVDGLEEYKCVTCGVVKESQPIPAGMATVKNLYGFIKDAPENGTITTDFGKLHTISDYLLKKMAERSDATVTIQFEYKNQKLQITFPAGTDYTPVLNDTDTMYGFYGVAAKLGLTVTERQ